MLLVLTRAQCIPPLTQPASFHSSLWVCPPLVLADAHIVTLDVAGSSIEIDAVKAPTGANFTVVLDSSTTYGPYFLYSPTTTVDNVWSQSQLDPTATHTIVLQKVQASAPSDSTLAINVDAFRYVPWF